MHFYKVAYFFDSDEGIYVLLEPEKRIPKSIDFIILDVDGEPLRFVVKEGGAPYVVVPEGADAGFIVELLDGRTYGKRKKMAKIRAMFKKDPRWILQENGPG